MSEGRALYISSYPLAMGGGRALRTYTCIRALALCGPVDVVFVDPWASGGIAPEYDGILGMRFLRIVPSRGLSRGLAYGLGLLLGVPPSAARGLSFELVRGAVRVLRDTGVSYDRIVVGDPTAAAALVPFSRRARLTFNGHNAVGTYEASGSPDRWWARRVGRRFERRLLEQCWETWMVSRADVESARALVPGARIRLMPNVVDVQSIAPVPPSDVPPDGGELLLVADFAYGPNVEARDFLVDCVLPLLWQRRRRANLVLVGRGLDGWTPHDPRIRCVGFVESLDAAYAGADCVVIPLHSGGGSPLKFVEALAYGRPIVATSFAARGLDVEAGEHYFRADTPEEVVEAVISALDGDSTGMVRKARSLAERRYSVEALAISLQAT